MSTISKQKTSADEVNIQSLELTERKKQRSLKLAAEYKEIQAVTRTNLEKAGVAYGARKGNSAKYDILLTIRSWKTKLNID